ncbi:MAG TPA: hypothetical protein VJN95_07380, partial [Gemmatimonadales bacterium]|nr:hypothetical protein [Gemmatimonadales bacterium]
MTRHSIAGALAAAALIAACDSPQAVTPPPTGPFSISPVDPWAGSTVLIRSADFSAHGHGAFVRLGTDSLALTRVDDTTMSAAIPDTVGGEFTPQVVVDGLSFPLQPITISGYASYHQYEPWLEQDIYAWPRTGAASVMGGTATGLTFIDLDAGTVTTDDTILNLNYIRGPGATYRDSVFLLARAGSALESWRLLPTPALLDTAGLSGFAYYRQAMQLGPNTLWTGADNGWYIWTRSDANHPYSVTGSDVVSETEGVYISPRH